MQNRIKVAWFASAFIGREASGTAQVAKKIVEYILLNELDRIEMYLIVKDEFELNLIQNSEILSLSSLILLPQVKGNFLKSSRQFYKYLFCKNKIEIDILHFSVPRFYPFFWKFNSKKFFCTFHAGGDISQPKEKFILSRLIYNLIAKLYWKKLDNIFAVSEFGKSEIELFYGIPKNHISIIYPGSDHLWNITSEALRIDHSKCNIVIIGRWQKYKNVHSVLEALLNLEVSLLKYFHIFIIGRQNSSYKHHIQKLINQFQFNNLSLYDYLSDGELKYLYQNADLIINPSINEGFGIPAFEAFAEGAPIAVHQGLPADVLLSNKPQVYIVDMLNIESLIALLRNHKTFRHVSVNERRSYLIDNSLTWNQMCKNYVSRYLDV